MWHPRRALFGTFISILAVGLFALPACEQVPTETSQQAMESGGHAQPRGGPMAPSGGPFTFDQPVFDIEAAPTGDILVAETVLAGLGVTGSTTIWEIGTRGGHARRKVVEFTTPGGLAPIHGLVARGQRNIYAARGGLDLAEHAALLEITPAGPEVVGDIESFEKANDPDKFAIGDWKDPQCARASGPFTPGPQSNPFHVAPESGSTMLVADAAGNTLLRVERSGDIEVVALFTPPAEDGTASDDPDDWMEFPFEGAADGSCFVQPVPNSVAVGPDGAVYVGELTGVGALGVSRVWQIEPGTTDAVCDGTSAGCDLVLTGLTSIIDIGFGPDDHLYVVEYDEAGWLTSLGLGTPAGGTVNRCDVGAQSCEIAEIGGETLEELTFPAAITFDTWGGAWLLENNLLAPMVRELGSL